MSKKKIYIPLIILGTIILAVLIHPLFLPSVLNSRLQKLDCEPCDLNVKGVRVVGLAPFSVQLTQFHISLGKPDETHWQFVIPETQISFTKNPLTSKTLEIENLRIEGLQVELSNEKTPPKTKSKPIPFPKFSLQKFEILKASFKYITRDPEGGHEPGEIAFRGISLKLEPFSSLGLRKNPNAKKMNDKLIGSMNGELDGGKIELALTMEPNLNAIDLSMKAELKDIKVQAMNSYLKPVESIGLSGNLYKGSVHSEMRDQKLETTSSVVYDSLEAEILSENPKGSILTTVFEGLMNFQMCNTNKDRTGMKLQKTSKITKRDDESAVQFLLRGMLDTGIKLSCLDGLPI